VSACAALICYHDDTSIEVTYWHDRDQARQAEGELAPCGPQCIGVHAVVHLDVVEPRPRGRHLARFLA